MKKRNSENSNTGESFPVYDTKARVDYTPSVPLTFNLIKEELEALRFITTLDFVGKGDVDFTPSAFEDFKGRWNAYIRDGVRVNKEYPHGDHMIRIVIIGKTEKRAEHRFRDICEEFGGDILIERGKTPMLQIPMLQLTIQKEGGLKEESEKLARGAYN